MCEHLFLKQTLIISRFCSSLQIQLHHDELRLEVTSSLSD